MNASSTTVSVSGSRFRRLTGMVLALSVTAIFVLGDPTQWPGNIQPMIDKLGPWGPVVFAGCFVLAAVLMVPGAVLTLTAGALFGLGEGVVITSLASTTASAIAFLIGRFVAHDAVAAMAEKRPSFQALLKAVSKDGWKVVVLTRLSPVLPYGFLNYAFGLTEVGFWKYVLASWAGMLPGTFMYVYLGSVAKAGLAGGGKTPAQWALHATGMSATVVVTVMITRRARAILKETQQHS